MTAHSDDKREALGRPQWLPDELWPYRIRTARPLGCPVAYLDEGEGPTLLLVHDGMWSYVWGQVIGRLRAKFRVITLDFPGAGLSPRADRPVGLEADSQLLDAFIDELGLTDFTLVLHDLGGPVGVGAGARRPERVEGFVFSQTFSWPPHVATLRAMLRLVGSPPITALDVATNLIFRLTTTRFGLGRHLTKRARQAFLGPYEGRSARRRFHQLMASVRREQEYLSGLERSLRTTLAGTPALTIYGENNDPFGFQALFKELLPHAEGMVIPGGNHFPMADAPEEFAERVARWHRMKVDGPPLRSAA